MEEDIKICEEMIKRLDKNCFDIYRKASNTEDYLGTIIGNEIISIENLIKEFKKAKIENIEYQIGQLPDTTEDYKNLKKELEKWKSGEM